MAYNLTNEERETIILFNEADGTADITTFNGALTRKLTKLCKDRPDECSGHPTTDGEYAFTVPKKWIKVNAGPTYTEEQKAALTENLPRLNSKK